MRTGASAPVLFIVTSIISITNSDNKNCLDLFTFFCKNDTMLIHHRNKEREILDLNNRNKRSDPDSELYRAILKLESLEECYNFFADLCTVSEMKAMEQRFEVAKLLNDGLIYNDILEKTGASSATISRVNRSLNYGTDAYRTIFEKMDQEKKA